MPPPHVETLSLLAGKYTEEQLWYNINQILSVNLFDKIDRVDFLNDYHTINY